MAHDSGGTARCRRGLTHLVATKRGYRPVRRARREGHQKVVASALIEQYPWPVRYQRVSKPIRPRIHALVPSSSGFTTIPSGRVLRLVFQLVPMDNMEAGTVGRQEAHHSDGTSSYHHVCSRRISDVASGNSERADKFRVFMTSEKRNCIREHP